jgi:hypothetical protein
MPNYSSYWVRVSESPVIKEVHNAVTQIRIIDDCIYRQVKRSQPIIADYV